MKKIFMAMTAIFLFGCQEDVFVEGTGNEKVSVKASLETDSRTMVDKNGYVNWSKDDKLLVFGEKVQGELTLEGVGGSTTGIFSGYVHGNQSDLTTALYPAELADVNGKITLTDVTYPNSNAPMMAKWGKTLNFKHLAGMLRIFITGLPKGTSTLSVSGIGIAGTATINDGKLTGFSNDLETITVRDIPKEAKYVDIPLYPVNTTLSIKINNSTPIEMETKLAKGAVKCLYLTIKSGKVTITDIYTGWYNKKETEFTIYTEEEFDGLAKLVDNGTTFEGQTVKLGNDIDLYAEDENGDPICFDPIGSYRKELAFKGTFDGQGHTISNLNQNTWALDNGYYYGDLGLGLFGKVEDATVKNLVMDNANISGEIAICGVVAATAYGDCTFENITVKNSKCADYQYYSGGIVGWASGNHKYINCNVDASTTVAAQWGDFDNSIGGVIGGAGGSATILMKDCNVACRIDAYNDVTSSYLWYAYRRCGMLIGNTGKTVTKDGTTYAAAPQLTCENVTVTYGNWANYTYCEFAGTSWPYVRVQAGVSNSAYSNPRYGHPTDANGNEVVDDNHVHNDGEDHHILCAFDQLYGGGQGVYGTASHEGVKVVYKNK